MEHLLRSIAATGASELVKSRLARELAIAPAKVDSYEDLLRQTHILVEIPAWDRSYRGRLVKRPKAMLGDCGLSAALTRLTANQTLNLAGHEYYGLLAEQFVALELTRQRRWSATEYQLSHFRDRDGLEVDLVAETSDGRLVAIEITSTMTPSRKHWPTSNVSETVLATVKSLG